MLKPKTDFEPIAVLSMESVACRALVESVRMKLYDLLDTPRTLTRIAATLDIADRPLEAFLDLLEARGLLVKTDGMYVNSPVASEYLVSTSAFYQGNALALHEKSNDYVVREMTSLLRGTAKPVGHRPETWAEPEALEGMAQYSLRGGLQDTVQFVASLPGFTAMQLMCDIGGSHGCYAMGLLDRNPDLHAVIADLPSVIAAATIICREAGYGERLSATACDLRTDAPPESTYDLVLASHVLYPFWDKLEEVVAKLAASLKPGGWFVSHHLDPTSDASRAFFTAVDLTTCLMGNVKHIVSPPELEAAMDNAGLSNRKTATSGFHGENVILAAQRKP